MRFRVGFRPWPRVRSTAGTTRPRLPSTRSRTLTAPSAARAVAADTPRSLAIPGLLSRPAHRGRRGRLRHRHTSTARPHRAEPLRSGPEARPRQPEPGQSRRGFRQARHGVLASTRAQRPERRAQGHSGEPEHVAKRRGPSGLEQGGRSEASTEPGPGMAANLPGVGEAVRQGRRKPPTWARRQEALVIQ